MCSQLHSWRCTAARHGIEVGPVRNLSSAAIARSHERALNCSASLSRRWTVHLSYGNDDGGALYLGCLKTWTAVPHSSGLKADAFNTKRLSRTCPTSIVQTKVCIRRAVCETTGVVPLFRSAPRWQGRLAFSVKKRGRGLIGTQLRRLCLVQAEGPNGP